MGQDWRDRLRGAIEATERSQRDISLQAGMAPGYVNSLFNEAKDPRISNLLKILDEIDVSLSYILYGIEMSPEMEELLRLFERLNPDQKVLFRQLAQTMANPPPQE